MALNNLCKCGCGMLCQINYKRGHSGNSMRGKHLSDERRIEISRMKKGIHPKSEFKKGQHISPETEFKKGIHPKSEFKKGYHASSETEFKYGQIGFWRGKKRPDISEEKNGNWKGDDVGYFGLHDWVNKQFGKAYVCKICGSKKVVQWANKSHDYKRDLSDWISLCRKCHVHYDLKNNRWGCASKLIKSQRGYV